MSHTSISVDAAPGIRLWADATGDPETPALLLVMGANASGIAWPDALVACLAEHHRVIRYDHRDTGRSTTYPAGTPGYSGKDLVTDAIAIEGLRPILRSARKHGAFI